MINYLRGKKSFIIAILAAIYAIIGVVLGKISPADCINLLFGASALAAIRAAFANTNL
jgi:hypothetical protein